MSLKERSRYRIISLSAEQKSLMKSNKLESLDSYTDGFYSSEEQSDAFEDSDYSAPDPFRFTREK